jgi:hypothetical protein
MEVIHIRLQLSSGKSQGLAESLGAMLSILYESAWLFASVAYSVLEDLVSAYLDLFILC